MMGTPTVFASFSFKVFFALFISQGVLRDRPLN